MRRTLLAFAAVFLLLASSLATVAAQAGTPGAQSPAGANGKGVIPVGTAVTLVDNNDQPSAKLTVTKLEDPFTGFEQSSPPQRGFHFVAATVSLFNVGSQPVSGNGYFQAVDSDGFTYQQTYVYLPSGATQPQAFNGITANPGEVQTGIVYFQVLNNVKLERVVYQPDFQRWLTLLDLRDEVTAPGTAVNVVDANGQPMAQVTVTKFEEPIANVDSSSTAQRGFEFAGAQVEIVNKSAAAITVDPSNFVAIDADGFAYTYYGVDVKGQATPEANFQYGASVDPGQSITGLLSYQVLKGSKLNQIIYAPNTGAGAQFIEIANQGLEGVKSAATPGPQPTPSAEGNASGNASDAGNASGNASDQGNASGNASDQGNASSVPTPDVSGVDCNAVLDWANNVLFGNLTALTGIATDLAQWETAQNPVTTIDPAKARADAKTASDAANAIKKSKTPKEIQPIADAFAGIMQAYADGFNSLAAHVEAKDAAGIKADFDALNKASDSFNNPQLNALGDALSSACPDLENLGE